MLGIDNCLNGLFPRLVEVSDGDIIAGAEGDCIDVFEGDAGLEEVGDGGQRAELFMGRHERSIGVALALLSRQAGPVTRPREWVMNSQSRLPRS